MKSFLFSLFAILSSFLIQAQAPFSFNYQGQAADQNGDIIRNTSISILIEIVDEGSGQAVFQEQHNVITSSSGIFSLRIGEGSNISGDMASVHWESQRFNLHVGMDPSGGVNFQHIGQSPLVSVPFALHANTVTNNDDADPDPANELQTISFDVASNILTLSNGGQVSLQSLDNDGGSGGGNSDNQLLSLTGTILSIEDGNSVDLGVLKDGNEDADADPGNELQVLNFNDQTKILGISQGNNVNLSALSGSDDQVLSLQNKNLSIENGNTIDLSPIASPWIPENNQGLSYESGTVYTKHQFITESLDVGNNQPSRVRITDDLINVDHVNDDGTYSILNSKKLSYFIRGTNDYTEIGADSIYFQSPDITEKNTISHFGNYLRNGFAEHFIYADGSSIHENNSHLLLKSNHISIHDPSPIITSLYNNHLNMVEGGENEVEKQALLTIDSFTIFRKGVGLLFDSKSTMTDIGLHSEFGPNISTYSAFGMNSTNGTYDLETGPQGIIQQYDAGLPQKIEKLSLDGDALKMKNNANFETLKLGLDHETQGGTLQLYNQGHAYSNLYQDLQMNSYFELNNQQSNKIYMAAFDDQGLINTLGENGSLNVYLGSALHNDNKNRGGLGVMDETSLVKAGMEVGELGFGEMYVDGSYKVLLPDGSPVSYSSQFGYILVDPDTGNTVSSVGRELTNALTGRIVANGENQTANVFIGANWKTGNENFGAVEVYDNIDQAQAGILVHENGKGQVYGDQILVGATGPTTNEPYPLTLVQPGSFGLGITRANGNNAWELYHSESANLDLYHGGNIVGSFNPVSGAYSQLSDQSKKINVSPIEDVIPQLLKLNPCQYNYKNQSTTSASTSMGLIAQEAAAIFPNLVYEHKNDRTGAITKMVDYQALSTLAIKGLQEQQNIISTQEKEIAVLKEKVDLILSLLNK